MMVCADRLRSLLLFLRHLSRCSGRKSQTERGGKTQQPVGHQHIGELAHELSDVHLLHPVCLPNGPGVMIRSRWC